MNCLYCGGPTRVNGDGDIICEGECGSVLTRQEVEETMEEMEHAPTEYEPTEYDEWQDVYGGDVEEYGTFGCHDSGCEGFYLMDY